MIPAMITLTINLVFFKTASWINDQAGEYHKRYAHHNLMYYANDKRDNMPDEIELINDLTDASLALNSLGIFINQNGFYSSCTGYIFFVHTNII